MTKYQGVLEERFWQLKFDLMQKLLKKGLKNGVKISWAPGCEWKKENEKVDTMSKKYLKQSLLDQNQSWETEKKL